MADKVFAPTAKDAFERIDALFSYLKSGILVNRIKEDYVQIAMNPMVANLTPYIVRSVYIDTPNREITIAILRYPYFAQEDDARYYILFHEELTWSRRNTLLAECDKEEFEKAIEKIREILSWYQQNRGEIAARKFGVLMDIYSNTNDEGKKVILNILETLKKA